MGGWAGDGDVVLDDHSVMDDGEGGWAHEGFFVETRAVEDDIVDVPSAWGSGHVDQGGHESVQRRSLTVRVGLVVVGVEDLHFVLPEKENAGVASALAVPCGGLGGGPFDVQLDVRAVLRRGGEASPLRGYLDVAIFHFPRGLPV